MKGVQNQSSDDQLGGEDQDHETNPSKKLKTEVNTNAFFFSWNGCIYYVSDFLFAWDIFCNQSSYHFLYTGGVPAVLISHLNSSLLAIF